MCYSRLQGILQPRWYQHKFEHRTPYLLCRKNVRNSNKFPHFPHVQSNKWHSEFLVSLVIFLLFPSLFLHRYHYHYIPLIPSSLHLHHCYHPCFFLLAFLHSYILKIDTVIIPPHSFYLQSLNKNSLCVFFPTNFFFSCVNSFPYIRRFLELVQIIPFLTQVHQRLYSWV